MLALLLVTCVPKKAYISTSEQLASHRDSLERVYREMAKAVQAIEVLQAQRDSAQYMLRVYSDSLVPVMNDSLQQLAADLAILQHDSSQNTLLLDSVKTLARQNQRLRKRNKQLVLDVNWLKYLNNKLRDSLFAVSEQLLLSGKPINTNMAGSMQQFSNTFDYYIADLSSSKLEFYWKDEKGKIYSSLDKLRTGLRANQKMLVFATNGGMYTSTQHPQGLYIEDGQLITPLDTVKNAYGNFYMQPNGVFLIDDLGQAHVMTTQAFKAYTGKSKQATQSGPMLVIDGKLHPRFNKGSPNKYIRSGVGVMPDNKIVFIISRKPVNFYDFAVLFRDEFKCNNALYLDGAISRMYLPEIGRKQLGGSFGVMIGVVR